MRNFLLTHQSPFFQLGECFADGLKTALLALGDRNASLLVSRENYQSFQTS